MADIVDRVRKAMTTCTLGDICGEVGGTIAAFQENIRAEVGDTIGTIQDNIGDVGDTIGAIQENIGAEVGETIAAIKIISRK